MNNNKQESTVTLDIVPINTENEHVFPLIEGSVSAGFPSPAQDYTELGIDLNKALISNPQSTFFCRVKGNSMQDEGINDGDILIVDKSLDPRNGDTVICFIDGEFLLKYIRITDDAIYLVPANELYKTIRVTQENSFYIWGVVTYSIKKHRGA